MAHNFLTDGPLKLNQKHIIAAALIATGATQKEVALALDLSPHHVSVLCRMPLFQAEVKRLQDKMQDALTNQAVEMLRGESVNNINLLKKFRDDAKMAASIRFKAATDMLDRVPQTSKTHRVENSEREIHFSESQVNYLIEALEDDPVAKQAFKDASQRSYLDLAQVEEIENSEASEAIEISQEALAFVENTLVNDESSEEHF